MYLTFLTLVFQTTFLQKTASKNKKKINYILEVSWQTAHKREKLLQKTTKTYIKNQLNEQKEVLNFRQWRTQNKFCAKVAALIINQRSSW